ncbi:uncharacterized protein LOC135218083 [Macrobrachium nipponense]|uniref:uncharacterized protein LOC135218083 n=1 Tax=Macrobrachium nipponense TaxID=159736 RepID=UPI0030C82522
MYYGKGMIPSANFEEFSKLCKSMQVSRLTNILQMQQSETKIHDRKLWKKGNVFIYSGARNCALVVKRLLMLFDVKGKTDLTLVVGNKRIYTHKSLLGMTCPVFHTVLMEEHSNEQSAVLISDADPISVTAVITLLYNGSCFITRAQMKLAASFLDPGLFKLHMSGDMPLQTDSRAEPTGSVDSNEGLLWHSENKLSSPQRRVILQDGIEQQTLWWKNMKFDEDVQLSESRQKLSVAGPRIKSRSGQVDGMNCDDTLPKKRKRRSKFYNCDEWVTEESERGAAVVGKCPTGSDKILSSKSGLKGHMKAHIGESLSDTTVSKACKNSVTSATSCNRVKSCKGKKCRFCKRYFYGKGLEQHIKLKHSHKETEECSSNDVTEEGIQCMEDKDISTTQNLLSDCSKILNNKVRMRKIHCTLVVAIISARKWTLINKNLQ